MPDSKRGVFFARWAELAVWLGLLVAASALLVLLDYHSRDPDSLVYAAIARDTAVRPFAEWIAPTWGAQWGRSDLFRDHGVGIFILPMVLIKAGLPGDQASYVANMLYQVLGLYLAMWLSRTVGPDRVASALMCLLQLIPVAFVYRIRANHEAAVLMGLLLVVYSIHRARSNGWWSPLSIAAFCFLVLVKGAFAVFALGAVIFWLFLIPAPEISHRRNSSPGNRLPVFSGALIWSVVAAMVISAGLLIWGYEALYESTTGESFLRYYRSERLSSQLNYDNAASPLFIIANNVTAYIWRLAALSFPWGVCALLAATVVLYRSKLIDLLRRSWSITIDQRALLWAAFFSIFCLGALSLAVTRADRFLFPCYWILAGAGVFVVDRMSPRFYVMVSFLSNRKMAPFFWMILFLFSLGSHYLGIR